jgi:Xaa-Pro aminopeptidase
MWVYSDWRGYLFQLSSSKNIGAVFYGYSSDITRTFLPKRTNIDDCDSFHGNRTLQDLWTVVYDAQSAAIASLNTNHTCADVDLAARRVIDDADLGEYFTHRLGHGLGIEGHERYRSSNRTNTGPTSTEGTHISNFRRGMCLPRNQVLSFIHDWH